MRVIVTGNNSAVASKLVKDIRDAGHKVSGMYAKGKKPVKAENVEYCEYAVSPKANVIVHCYEPAQVYSPDEDLRKEVDTDVLNEMNAALKVNPKARVIYISSAGIYQKNDGFEPTDGLLDVTKGIISNVDIAHALAETLLNKNVDEKNYYIIRPANLYTKDGPNLFFRELDRTKALKFPVLPAGSTEFSITSDHNLGVLVNRFIDDYKAELTGIYNLSDDNPIKSNAFVTELFRAMPSESGRRSKPVFIPVNFSFTYAVSLEAKGLKKNTLPSLTRTVVANTGRNCRVDISKAKELVTLSETGMDYLVEALS